MMRLRADPFLSDVVATAHLRRPSSSFTNCHPLTTVEENAAGNASMMGSGNPVRWAIRASKCPALF